MNEQKKNTENQELGNAYGQNNGNRPAQQRTDNSGDNINQNSGDDNDTQNNDTDKYLALEQPGVTYTHESNPTANSDQTNLGYENSEHSWNPEGGNSKYSDAFNQDDYLLEDNVDLDEDQNKSISSDDEDFEETNERY